jgi:hypothetical protein
LTPPFAHPVYNPDDAIAQRDSESDFLAAIEPEQAVEHRAVTRRLSMMAGMLESLRIMAGSPTEESQRGFRCQLAKAGLRGGR